MGVISQVHVAIHSHVTLYLNLHLAPPSPPRDLSYFLLHAASYVPKYGEMIRLIERNVTDGDPEYQEVHVAAAQLDELGLWYACVRKQLESQDEQVVDKASEGRMDKTSEIRANLQGADAVTRGKVSFYPLRNWIL